MPMSSPVPAAVAKRLSDDGAAAGSPTTFNFSRVAAAVDASIAWLDDGRADVDGNRTGEPARWTMTHSLLRAIPALASAAAASAHDARAGETVCGVRVSRDGGLGVDARLCASVLRSVVHVLTNLTNENPAGCAAVRACDGGLDNAASLVPWCAALQGLIPGAGPSKEKREEAAIRSGEVRKNATRAGLGPAAAARQAKEDAECGVAADMLNAAMCLLVNMCEIDAETCKALRTLETDVGALECVGAHRGKNGKKTTLKSAAKARAAAAALASRHVGLVELLTQIFVRSGGAGPVDEDGNVIKKASEGDGDGDGDGDGKRETRKTRASAAAAANEPEDDEVTAEMIEAREKEGDGLITQAYAALLAAFLVENQPALRADVVCSMPEGGLAAMAGVLERFRAFHENLDSISEESHASLSRIIKWLKGNN
ncbi:uncharacterized protein MICPUCDRAFT_63060 [Micromonas pusilla CCMP1545]|uniref:Predicted protein n=1 Tax=Micromonas pusilla (strain CCMP1545) TaxID=564608 RepID=C1N1C2_MICPC|nr:uncharacterized protein MICPUCDRAFT_63060 [Micromonas pusilla CCMP1545]EEH54418.1 predicted protein [Micromonas pusilla CCMP1545]|eukprot:XP_003061788.1 predicted protein [Micromonas pusilla CCMP1545]